MVRLTKNIKSKKQKIIRQRECKTKAARKRNTGVTQLGGAGRIVKQWHAMPEFTTINNQNEAHLQLSATYNDKPQHEIYYSELAALLEYKAFEINMDFISNFYRHVFYDVEGKYAIDLTKGQKNWTMDSDAIQYTITNYHINPTHGNTTIVFLKEKAKGEHEHTQPRKKVIKVFNNIPCNMDSIREFLSLEISHISPKSRNLLNQYNYIHYDKLNDFDQSKDSVSNTFNVFNFNHKQYYVPEVSEKNTYVSLSCRNSDPINEYIVNLIIGYVNANLDEDAKIRYVHYDNLFVTRVHTDTNPEGKLCWCLLMDMVDGSLDSLILKQDKQTLSTDTILDYLKQAEKLMMPLKTADYLFTHTDMKLENLFYKKKNVNGDEQVEIYLADLDKSSITFKGIRFYNDIRENPNLKFGGISIVDPVQGYAGLFKGDKYLINTYNKRKECADHNKPYKYRISRFARTQNIGLEFEAFYMRYNNQPYYTSFDIITLWLSILHFRKETKPIIDFRSVKKKSSKLTDFLLKYMTRNTIDLLIDFYKKLTVSYKGNFGLLINPIYSSEKSKLSKINFLHHYDNAEQPKLIRGLYLTHNNKIALSMPYVPTLIQVKDDITSFKPNQKKTADNKFYNGVTKQHVKDFIKSLSTDNILSITYTSDYSIAAERGAILAGLMHQKPPAYVIKTNRYSFTTLLGLIPETYYYEWDYMVNESDISAIIKLFSKLAITKNTSSKSKSSSSLVNVTLESAQ
jgi:hypothetical protein